MALSSSSVLSPEQLSLSVESLKSRHHSAPWAETLTENDRYRVVVICQPPGHQNDWHYHLTDECWYIYEGNLSWTLEGQDEPVVVKAGDWILAPANACHFIQVLGDQPSIRIAISYAGEFHRHEREGGMPPAPAGARVG
ncbi:MAG: cupin domain-containing protein [Acidimicrobiaceae bacterium]|nr:cupin domain-containing protein [Acidimicrobiaceae bacterium]